MNKNYQAPKSELWQGRKDSQPNERFFQIIECVDLTKNHLKKAGELSFALLGFCSDTGIKRNLGRPGAAQGPDALRSALGNLALGKSIPKIYDVGNVIVLNDDLETAQKNLGEIVTAICDQEIIPIVLGGGHETAWGHYQGLAKTKNISSCGIINFDAHFDLRPLQNNQGTSGTPFSQIALDCQQTKKPFSYFCIGIQKFANTQSLFETAKELDVGYLTAEEIYLQSFNDQIAKLDKFLKQQKSIYLSLCLDVFSNNAAPGVSAPQPLGLYPWQVIPLLRHLVKTQKVKSFDVVELSPPFDINNRTAQLGANLIAEFVSSEID